MFKSAPTAMFLASFVLLAGVASRAQDMTGLDVTSDAFTKSQMSRSDIESAISNLPAGAILDLSGKSLNGLDLSGLDLHRVKLQSARINNVNFKGANLEGVVLDQAWALKSDLSGANLKNSSLFRDAIRRRKARRCQFFKRPCRRRLQRCEREECHLRWC